MEETKKHFPLRMLVTITDTSREKKLEKVLDEFEFPVIYQIRGKGTVKSEFLKIVGLSDNIRIMTFTLVLRSSVPTVFKRLQEELSVKNKGTGIAFTIPINGTQAFLMRRLDEGRKKILEEKMEKMEQEVKNEVQNALILIVVNQGYSDEVMETAREAGAYGGTVIKCRRQGLEKTMQFLGVSIQEEQEIVAILVPKEIKHQVMQTVGGTWGPKSPARAVILSLPVDEVIGVQR